MSALVSQVYSYGRRNNAAKHIQLICLGCGFWGEMNCSHVTPDFLLTMTKGKQAEKVRCLTFKHLRIDVLNLFNCRGQEGRAQYKLSVLKQSFITPENVTFVQNFIFTIQ